ncbi:ATP-binding protein [Sorangium sp. So ce590]|uniref:ATP-binding protein n=1 Tax=Sorangium sp. So ce590 TaxID=3133317 RepID=UPI003F6301F2
MGRPRDPRDLQPGPASHSWLGHTSDHHTMSTGIGLALVKKLVESSGGAIALDSDVGRGAAFSFTWPKAA